MSSRLQSERSRRILLVYLLVASCILLADRLWQPVHDRAADQLYFISDSDSIDAGRGSNAVYRIGLDGRGAKRILGAIPHGAGYLRSTDIDCHADSRSLVIASHKRDLNGFHHSLLDGSGLHLDAPKAGEMLTSLREIALGPDGISIIASRQEGGHETPRYGLVRGDLAARVFKSIKPATARHSYISPAWSPDGQRIAYIIVASAEDGGVSYKLALAQPDGSGEQVIHESNWQMASVVWSPAGDRLAAVIGAQIYSIKLDGSGLTRLSNHQAGASMPRWSSDGARISFVAPSSFPGFNQLLTMAADGGDIRRVVNLRGEIINGCWL